MKAKILRASIATSGAPGRNAPGYAVETELGNGANVRLYVREGWAFDTMAINGYLVPVDEAVMDAVTEALDARTEPILLDMSYPAYLNWVPRCKTDYRHGTFADWQRLNHVEEG